MSSPHAVRVKYDNLSHRKIVEKYRGNLKYSITESPPSPFSSLISSLPREFLFPFLEFFFFFPMLERMLCRLMQISARSKSGDENDFPCMFAVVEVIHSLKTKNFAGKAL